MGSMPIPHHYIVTSHSRAVQLSDPDTMRSPTGENETEVTLEECHWGVFKCIPLIVSHNLIVLSSDADATLLPLGEDQPSVSIQTAPLRSAFSFCRPRVTLVCGNCDGKHLNRSHSDCVNNKAES